MPEALSNVSNAYVSPYMTAADQMTTQTKTFLTRCVIIGVDAAPSDTTIYTVPTGKVFYLTATSTYTNNAGGLLRSLYDSAGDVAANVKLGCFFNDIAAGTAHHEEYGGGGIPFTTGITMATADLIANKTFGLILHGYLV